MREAVGKEHKGEGSKGFIFPNIAFLNNGEDGEGCGREEEENRMVWGEMFFVISKNSGVFFFPSVLREENGKSLMKQNTHKKKGGEKKK